MDSEEKKLVAGCIAYCGGCFGIVLVLLVLLSVALAVSMKVFRLIAQ
jgi:hypothetical protein